MRSRKAMRGTILSLALLVWAALTAVVAPGVEDLDRGASELLIVARDMAFFVDGGTEENPPLHLQPGSQIVLSFRNDDPGMRHDLVIPILSLQSRLLSFGETERWTLRLPPRQSSDSYWCSLHPRSMRGEFRLR